MTASTIPLSEVRTPSHICPKILDVIWQKALAISKIAAWSIASIALLFGKDKVLGHYPPDKVADWKDKLLGHTKHTEYTEETDFGGPLPQERRGGVLRVAEWTDRATEKVNEINAFRTSYETSKQDPSDPNQLKKVLNDYEEYLGIEPGSLSEEQFVDYTDLQLEELTEELYFIQSPRDFLDSDRSFGQFTAYLEDTRRDIIAVLEYAGMSYDDASKTYREEQTRQLEKHINGAKEELATLEKDHAEYLDIQDKMKLSFRERGTGFSFESAKKQDEFLQKFNKKNKVKEEGRLSGQEFKDYYASNKNSLENQIERLETRLAGNLMNQNNQ